MPEEDRLLIRLVTEYSVDGEDIDWSILEQHFRGTRDSKQIRERWVNHLNPRIKKRKFSDKEIKIIEDECSKHKFKWAKIAKKIPNATPLMIKNFYNNRLKKKNPANNRRLINSAAITPYTINNFNNNPITSIPTLTTTTTTTIKTNNTTNINNITTDNNPNDDYNYFINNEYLREKDGYYDGSNLRRNNSVNSERTAVNNDSYHTSLTRNSSITSVKTNYSTKTLVEYESPNPHFPIKISSPSLPSPPLSSEMSNFPIKGDKKLEVLATVADIVSQSEPSSPTVPQTTKTKKLGIMAISNLLS
ncbi:hypothetical protein C1645_817647 [Glomus cerebriforme]|uniref:Homeodomain-like protein n=1 Tax=Glomus cerebriforme TaxID=658196 RepID=A0A397T916_9GLOM|nr:hypothetical protein C1645_817647 [Glomus cerebriforme]